MVPTSIAEPAAVEARISWRQRLFRPDDRAPARPGHRALAVVAVLVAAGLSLTRIPHGLDIVYAEDGSIFLNDALNKSFLGAIATPYSGYLHLTPRLLAELVVLFPAGAAPVALGVIDALFTSLLALFVYVASGSYLRSPVLRLVVAVPVALPMIGQGELPNSITMLRWLFMYVTFWALLWVPRRRTGQIVAALLVVLAAFTDNVVALYLPLALLRLWTRRDLQGWVSSIALAAGAAVNITIVATGISEHESIQPRVDPVWAGEAYVLRPIPQALFGEHWVGMRPEHDLVGLAPVGLAWLLVAVAVLVARRRVTAPDWPLAGLAFGYSVAVFLFVAMVAGRATGRYSVPSAILGLVALAFLLQPHPAPGRTGPAWRRVAPAVALAVLVAVAIGTSFRMDSLRAHGPLWSIELAKARAACAVPGTRTVDVPISPYELGWHSRLPCDYARR